MEMHIRASPGGYFVFIVSLYELNSAPGVFQIDVFHILIPLCAYCIKILKKQTYSLTQILKL